MRHAVQRSELPIQILTNSLAQNLLIHQGQVTPTATLLLEQKTCVKLTSIYPHCYATSLGEPYVTPFLLRILPPSRKSLSFLLDAIKLLLDSSHVLPLSLSLSRSQPNHQVLAECSLVVSLEPSTLAPETKYCSAWPTCPFSSLYRSILKLIISGCKHNNLS